jgi:AraC-like DNA-binding protein
MAAISGRKLFKQEMLWVTPGLTYHFVSLLKTQFKPREDSLQDFHFIRSSQARPFLLVLQGRGVPIEKLYRDTKLPLASAIAQPDGVIGEYALWKLIEAGGRDCKLLGYECAELFPLGRDYRLGDLPLRLGNNLEQTLEYFNEDVMQLSNASYYSLDRRSGVCWFRRAPAFGPEHASWQAELYTVSILLQVIRIHAGKNWLPPAIRYSSRHTPQLLPAPWKHLKAEWGVDATGIQLPDEILSLPPPEQAPLRRGKNKLERPNFRQFVSTQIAAGCIGIENAALQTGISVSTLQRILNASGTSYQDTLDLLRYEQARELLVNTGMPITEIALKLGYTHPGNFSRAFVRWEGISPAAYRTQNG